MDFAYSEEQEAFRKEIKDFMKKEPPENFPTQGHDEGYGGGAWSFEFNRRLGEKGWLSRCWPREYGGQGRPLIDLFILMDELSYQWAPGETFFYTEAVCSAIIRYASEEMKHDILPRAAKGEMTFWEGFSEPEAGSDMLAMTTRAVKKGDGYVVSGQKTWNSNAHKASHGFTAVKTDLNAPRHKGISVFIIDMKTPGITAKPIKAMYDGAPFAEVFFDEAFVSEKYLIGKENSGFRQILEGLEWDRFWSRGCKSGAYQRMLEEIVKYAREAKRNGRLIADDPIVRRKLSDLAVEIEVCKLLFYEPLCKLNADETLNIEASIGKTFADEMGQRFVREAVDIVGPDIWLNDDPKWKTMKGKLRDWYLCNPGMTLAGGTSEIQRNTIAIRGLGLPRE